MKMTTQDRDESLTAAYVGVAVSGALLLFGAGIWFGARLMGQVSVGVVLALSNLWILQQLVRSYLGSRGGRFALIALAKAAVLFVIVAALLRTGTVTVLPLVCGFGALPLGVVVGGAWPLPRES